MLQRMIARASQQYGNCLKASGSNICAAFAVIMLRSALEWT